MTITARILLIDCEELYRKNLVEELAGEELQVEAAASGEDALARLRDFGRSFDVVLLGRLHPQENGPILANAIRQRLPDAELILLEDPAHLEAEQWKSQLRSHASVDRFVDGRFLAAVIKREVLYRVERQRSLALQALVSAAERVGIAQDEETLYQRLYEEASDLLPGLDGFLIAHYDDQEREVSFPFAYSHDRRVHVRPRRDGNSIAEYVFMTKEPLLLPFGDEIFRMKHGLNPPDDNLGYSTSEMVAPMFLDGQKLFGAVFATSHTPGLHFTSEHMQILTTFARQAAVTIRNFIQLKEANQLRDATAALTGQRGRDGVLTAIIEGAHNIVKSDFTGLILHEEDGTLRKAKPVIPVDYFDKFDEPRQDKGLTRTAVEGRKPIAIPDTSKNRLVKEGVVAAGIKSMLVLPLIHREKVLGVLFTHTFKPRDFVARDVALWTAFSTQAAGALDRAIEEERQIGDYQRLVRELGSLEEPLNLEDTLCRVAMAAKSIFNSDTCRIFHIDPPTGKIMGTAWAEGDREEYHIEGDPRQDGMTRHVLRTRKPYFYPDMQGGPPPRPELISKNLRAAASLPLSYAGRDIGVMHLNYFTKQPVFNEHYETLMEAFGARAGVALNRLRREDRGAIWQSLDREIIDCTNVRQLYQLFTHKSHEALKADFAIFYPYDPTSRDPNRLPLNQEYVVAGDLRRSWRPPKGGRGGGVFREISRRDNMLIVNDLSQEPGRYTSNLARREGVKAFIAVRLEVIPPGTKLPQLVGILFIDYRQRTTFFEADLINLRYASELIAAGIMRLTLQADLERAYKQRTDQLRAVIEIFRTHENKPANKGTVLNLNHITEHAVRSLGLDACTIIEFDPVAGKFTGRGNFGLNHIDHIHVTPRRIFKEAYMHKDGPTVIPDVRKDPIMKTSRFVRREGIRSTVVFPLRAEGELLGLFFGNYRTPTLPPKEDLEPMGLLADVAAYLIHRANLDARVNEAQLKEDRRRLLVWVSMVEDMWQHNLVLKASSIRNYAKALQKRIGEPRSMPGGLKKALAVIAGIDQLAADIANAPPRVPHDSEMKNKELIPLGPLLQEIAHRERHGLSLTEESLYKIELNVKALGGVQVLGYRRWLIYLIESLLQNAYHAMPKGGQITITGSKKKEWAEVRIRDTGRGVPARVRDKLFKVAITDKRRRAGLGIGSLLVKTLVEENNGLIELEKPGPGNTTVLIQLPIASKSKKP